MSDLRPRLRTRDPRRRSRRLTRGATLAALGVLAVLTVWAAIGATVWGYAWLRLGGDEVSTLRPDVLSLGASGAVAPADATTVLVALTEPMDPTIPRPPALAGPVLLVQVGADRDLPAVLALPTETRVSVDGGPPRTLAEVQADGGVDLLVRSVLDYTEVRIDHAVVASVELLPGLVRELGPLEVCGADGCAEPTPDEVRAWQRAEEPGLLARRGADVVRSIASAVSWRMAATSPIATKRAIDLLDGQLVTDVSLRAPGVLAIAGALAEPTRLVVETLPVAVNPLTGERSVLEEAAVVRFQRLRDGGPLDTFDPEQDLERIKAEVRIAVLNGAGIDGLAAAVAADLTAAGLTVVGTGNAPVFDLPRTQVSYRAGDAAVERLVALLLELLPEAELQPLDRDPTFEGEPVPVTVTVGRDLGTTIGGTGAGG